LQRGRPSPSPSRPPQAYLEAQGPEIAFAAFTGGDDWRDRDRYVFVVDGTGLTHAHGADPDLVGVDQWELTDVNGFRFIQAIIAVESSGWVNYVWFDPVDGRLEPKSSYVIRVEDHFLGVGAYMPTPQGIASPGATPTDSTKCGVSRGVLLVPDLRRLGKNLVARGTLVEGDDDASS
jgi:cytochrome c